MDLNRIKFGKKDDPSKTKSYDIMVDDEFWNASHNLPFPEVIEKITAKMNEYKEKDAALMSLNKTFNVI